MIGEKYKQ